MTSSWNLEGKQSKRKSGVGPKAEPVFGHDIDEPFLLKVVQSFDWHHVDKEKVTVVVFPWWAFCFFLMGIGP